MDNQVPGNGLPPPADEPPGPVRAGPPRPTAPRPRMSVSTAWFLVIAFAIIALVYFSHEGGGRSEITYSFFHEQLVQDNIADAEFSQQQLLGKFKKAPPAPKSADADGTESSAAKSAPELLHQEFRTTL